MAHYHFSPMLHDCAFVGALDVKKNTIDAGT